MIEAILREADDRRARGDLVGAAAVCRRAIAAAPNNPRGYSRLGHIALVSFDYPTARAAFAEAVRIAPGDPGLRSNFGMMLTYVGEFDAAREQFRQAIAIDPDFVPAYYNIAPIAPSDEIAILADSLESIKRGGKRTDLEQSLMGFALGKLYDALGQWDQAFENYQLGNQKKGVRYDHAQTLDFFSTSKAVFSSTPAISNNDDAEQFQRPIFIVGMPRCGSTLVEELLARHEGVAGLGERSEIPHMIQLIASRHSSGLGYPRCAPKISTSELRELANRYFSSVERQAANASIIIDKQLLNFQYVPLLRMIFPAAAIVHCVRNPIDTCLSAYFTNFQTGFSYSFDLDDLGNYFRAYYDLTRHWRSIMPDNLISLQYEDLVSDRDRSIGALQKTLGLFQTNIVSDDSLPTRDIRTSSAWQARQPIYTHSVGRWKNYEKHIGPLIAALGDLGK